MPTIFIAMKGTINSRLTDQICGLAHWIGHPYAIAALALFTAGWLIGQAGAIGWGGVLAVFTMLVMIVIQASQNRDTAAIQAKLDELIEATHDARDSMAHIEALPEEDIKKRSAARAKKAKRA